MLLQYLDVVDFSFLHLDDYLFLFSYFFFSHVHFILWHIWLILQLECKTHFIPWHIRHTYYTLYLYLCCLVPYPNSIKLPSGLTELCNFANKDYDYIRHILSPVISGLLYHLSYKAHFITN